MNREPAEAAKAPVMYFPTRSTSFFSLGPDPAVNVGPGVMPGENPLGPLGEEELPLDQKPKNPRAKSPAKRESSIWEILWKRPASSTSPSVTRKWRWGWKLIRNRRGSSAPYIKRKKGDPRLKKIDAERYQTVYAMNDGSIAAPTAGLHFTEKTLDELKQKGVDVQYLTLGVGLATF